MAVTYVNPEHIAVNAISGTIIADNAVTAVHIAQNAILTQHIDDGQVGTSQLAADAVTGAKLADSSVVTANIQDDQVTGDKLANNITIAGTLGVTGVLTGTSLDISGDIDIDGTSNLDIVDIDGAVNMAAALTSTSTIACVAGANDPALAITGGTATQSYGKINMTGAGTAVDTIRISNDGGHTICGTERNTGGGLAGSSLGYASVFGSIGATAAQIMTNNSVKMTVLSGGNVGIGTVAPSADTGVARFLQIGSSSDAHSGLVLEDNSGQWEIQNNADLAFFYDASMKMIIEDGGNVGIGTNSPDTPLHVVGNNGLLVDTDGNGDGQVYFGHISGSDRSYIARSSDDFLIWNVASGNTRFGTNNTERMRIDSSGHVTMPYQPAFSAPASHTNIPLATTTQVTLGTERFDTNGDLSGNVFTAPVGGKYLFTYIFYFSSLDDAHTTLDATIKTSNTQYQQTVQPNAFMNSGSDGNFSLTGSMICDMDANDTFFMNVYVSAGTAQTDIHTDSHVSGCLLM